MQPSRGVSERPPWRMAIPGRTGKEGSTWAPESSLQAGPYRGLCQTSPRRFCRGPGAVCCPKDQRRKAWNPSPMSLPGFLFMMPGVRGVFP